MFAEIIVFLVTVTIVYILFTYKINHTFFSNLGINFVPGIPIFGNTLLSSIMKRHMIYDIDAIYKSFPDDRYVGYIEGSVPIILVRDPELIKQITVKDFDNFSDHRMFFSDPLFMDSLLMLRGDKWRDMRMTLSPAFTGSKMRQMVPFMMEVSSNIVEHLKETERQEIEASDLIRRYTNDVIASIAFGLQVNSLKDKENDFFMWGQTLMNFTGTQRIKMALAMMFPVFAKWLTIFPHEATGFFKNIVKSTMDHREKNNIERPDMIQLMMEASKGTLKANTTNDKDTVGFATTDEVLKSTLADVRRWTQEELAAQAFIFFIAGFESTAAVLVLILHQLALSTDVQDKLYKEVKEFSNKHERLAYDDVQELKYLDCVFNETLRKWSPAVIMDRVCQKPYVLPPPRDGAKPVKIKSNQLIYNVVNSIHMDDKHYPDANKFDPERFSDENKQNIKQFTFMPFGAGPRNCIASRFALLEAKVLIYNLILNFKIVKCGKTSDPIKLKPSDFNIRADGGSWVKFEARA